MPKNFDSEKSDEGKVALRWMANSLGTLDSERTPQRNNGLLVSALFIALSVLRD